MDDALLIRLLDWGDFLSLLSESYLLRFGGSEVNASGLVYDFYLTAWMSFWESESGMIFSESISESSYLVSIS